MACGATYALVPFIDRDALGGVAGIIGAGVMLVQSQQASCLKVCWIYKPV